MKFRFICLLLLTINQISYAQSNSNQTYTNYEQIVLPPSPNAASLARYIDYPVSLSTGVPDISIPLCTLTSKRLSVPISISYHAGGIKVSDRTFNMGAGWTLNAGGEISRSVRDVPDEAVYGYGYYNVTFPDENGSVNTAQKDYCLSNQIYDIYTSSHVKYDGEPDLFYYNFGGLSGTFLYRNRTASGLSPQPVTIPYSPIKISGNFQSFQTTDLDGNIYSFGGSTTANEDRTQSTSGFLHDYGNIVNAWYLTKIISADKTDSVLFTYEQNPDHDNNTLTAATGVLTYPQTGPASATSAIVYTAAASNTVDNTVRIKEIISANGKVDFTYDSNNRLNKLDIYTGNNSVYTQTKAYQVFQSQFTNCTRTRLDSIQEVGYLNNTIIRKNPPFKFGYYTADAPPVDSKDQDFWGFYNGRGNSDMLYVKSVSSGSGTNTTFVPAPEKRTPNEEMTKKGVLQKITYPTGGFSTFTLEENKVDTTVTTYSAVPNSATHHISTFYLVPNNQTTGVNITFTPNAKITGQVKMDFNGVYTCSPSGSCATNIPEAILFDITQNAKIDDILLTDLYHNTVTKQETVTYYTLNIQHQYKLYFPTPGNITTSGEATQYRLDVVLTEPLPDSSVSQNSYQTVLAGGLRVKQIVHSDNNGNTIIKNYKYVKSYFNNPTLFQGDYSYIISNLARDKYVYGGGTTPGNNNGGTWFRNSTTYTEGVNVPMGGTSNTALSYAQVEESMTNSSGTPIGKTLYTYNNTTDFLSNQFPMFRINRDYLRSQLLDTKTYKTDNTGKYVLIKEVANTYNNINDFRPDDPGRDSIKFYKTYINLDYQWLLAKANTSQLPDATQQTGTPQLSSFGCPIYANNLGGYLHISPFYYHVVRPLLTSTITTDYDLNGQNPVIAETDYAYDNLMHMQPTRITATNSNQKVKVMTAKYPLDYSYLGNCNPQSCVVSFNQQMATLKAQRDQCEQNAIATDGSDQTTHNNALNAYAQCETNYNDAVANLVSQYNSCMTQSQQCYVNNESSLGATDKSIAYMQDKNMVTPKVVATTAVNGIQTSQVKTDYQITDAGGNSIKPQLVSVQVGSNAIQPKVSFAYANSNLVQQQQVGGPPVAYQWGYNAQYPVAQVTNAKVNNIFYDSFEEGSGNSTLNDSQSGHYSYTGSYSKALTGLDAGTYQLSYWQKSGASWSLQSQAVSVTGSSYTISLSGQIDNVRFYPAGAQMMTYTYDPLVGMTSQADARGETTYYEYDGFQRLINIRDHAGNIIKHTDYHYQNQ